jgi:hypothetical protein
MRCHRSGRLKPVSAAYSPSGPKGKPDFFNNLRQSDKIVARPLPLFGWTKAAEIAKKNP